MSAFLRAFAAVAVLLAATLLPFLPGRHDPLATGLSIVALALGVCGLVLVPLASIWLAHASLRGRGSSAELVRRRYAFAVCGVLGFLGLVAVVVGLAVSGFALGILLAAAAAILVAGSVRRARRPRAVDGPDLATPLAGVLAPLALFLLQRTLAPPASEAARSRAIRNAAPMIEDIERYRTERGSYPLSLHSIWGDYDADVIGVERYRYEPSGVAYSLFFEEPSLELGARVVVMYNPRDEAVMASHDWDLLQHDPAELGFQRGFFASGPAGAPHWNWFLFD